MEETYMTRTRSFAPVAVAAAALAFSALSSAPALAQETTLTIEGVSDHYHTGDDATLTAVQDPETEHDHYHWFVRAAGASDLEVVSGEAGDTYTFTVDADVDGAEIVARLYDDDHDVVAESAAVTITIDDHDGHDHDRNDHDGHDHDGHDHDHDGHDHDEAPVGGVDAGFGGAAQTSGSSTPGSALLLTTGLAAALVAGRRRLTTGRAAAVTTRRG
jgi:hypothetical protein